MPKAKKGFILITLLIFTSVLGIMYLSHLIWLGGLGRQMDYFILESQARVLAESALEFKNSIPVSQNSLSQTLNIDGVTASWTIVEVTNNYLAEGRLMPGNYQPIVVSLNVSK
jgi:hypothetical protein